MFSQFSILRCSPSLGRERIRWMLDYLDAALAFSRPGEMLIANLFWVGLSQYRNAVASGSSYGYGSKLLTTTRRYRVTVLTKTH